MNIRLAQSISFPSIGLDVSQERTLSRGSGGWCGYPQQILLESVVFHRSSLANRRIMREDPECADPHKDLPSRRRTTRPAARLHVRNDVHWRAEAQDASVMSKNHALAGAVLDANPYEIGRQLEYKVAMRDGRIVNPDRFYPSSRTCSVCGLVVESLALSMRSWTCVCGTHHDRDANPAINLERLGRATAEVTRGDMAASTDARKGAGKRRG